MNRAAGGLLAIVPILALVAAAVYHPTPAAAQQATVAAVFQQFADAINRGDVNGALNLFHDDATWERGGQCPPGRCVGKEALRRELDRDVANRHEMKVVEVRDSAARVELQTQGTRSAGVPRIIQLFTIGLRDGRIGSVRVVVDQSDPVTAAFQTRGMASTADSDSDDGFPTEVAIAVGVAVVLALAAGGVFIARRRRGASVT